jgi:betaine lipid synthase
MSQFLDVPEFFSSVYLVDFSPSLCEVARKRFARLGWTNVKVICEDAKKFRLEDYENGHSGGRSTPTRSASSYFEPRPDHGGADLVTMSYSLSMIVGSSRTEKGRATQALTDNLAARLPLGH